MWSSSHEVRAVNRLPMAPSSPSWIAAAVSDLDTLLVDHAHCEKKAASTAVRFLFRYPDRGEWVLALSRLAREELVHFEQVLRELKFRGVAFGRLSSSGYANELFRFATSPGDDLLVCALIEARSHERFVSLSQAVPEDRLARFYADLAEAEARHGELYLELAEDLARRDLSIRVAELIRIEEAVLHRPGQPLRMHSGGL
jgi:tRNA-(ms[2]io[6]A)-hydroxylase